MDQVLNKTQFNYTGVAMFTYALFSLLVLVCTLIAFFVNLMPGNHHSHGKEIVFAAIIAASYVLFCILLPQGTSVRGYFYIVNSIAAGKYLLNILLDRNAKKILNPNEEGTKTAR